MCEAMYSAPAVVRCPSSHGCPSSWFGSLTVSIAPLLPAKGMRFESADQEMVGRTMEAVRQAISEESPPVAACPSDHGVARNAINHREIPFLCSLYETPDTSAKAGTHCCILRRRKAMRDTPSERNCRSECLINFSVLSGNHRLRTDVGGRPLKVGAAIIIR
jgi:hypothetical protein